MFTEVIYLENNCCLEGGKSIKTSCIQNINFLAKPSRHLSVSSQINTRDASGQTPLHLACERGDLPCVKELLEESQARTDIKDRNGETPMHCAGKQDSPAIIQVRLSRSEDTVTFLSDPTLTITCEMILKVN